MKKYSFSIVSKITILVIGLVMITATLVGMVFYYGNNRFLLQNEFRNLARKTELLAPSLVNGINEGKRDLKFLIQTEDLLSYAIKDNKRKRKKLKTIFTEYLKAKNIQSITLIPYSKTFKALRVSKVPLERANFAPFKISEIERWQSVEEQKGGVSISGVSLRKISGEVVLPERPELHIAKELYLGDIRVGYLILTIDYGPNIKNLVNSVEQNYRVLIFNPDGDYLYGPDKKKNFGFDKGSRSLVQNDYRELGSFLTGRASTYSRFLEKKNREIIHVLKVPLEEKNPKSYLGLALITPHDKAVNAGVVVRRRSFIITILIIVFGGIGAWIFSHFITRSLNYITDIAERYTKGETSLEINVDSNDEIGLLALTFQGMIRQVNERTRILKRLERESREDKNQAEEASRAKTLLLVDLKKQKEEIEKVSRDKDELLAIVSHDLKNPLAVVETSMDIIMEDAGDDFSLTQKDLLRRSKNSARFALNLITDLLDLARLEGGIKLDFEKFSVKELIENSIDAHYLKAEQKNITVNTNFKGDFSVYADYARIIQVINNILGNSIKFTPQDGEINFSLSVREAEENESLKEKILIIKISDNGPGIPADKIDKIFNKYEQARSKDREIGTGLGLAICENICSLHDGKIWAESTEGEGATFTIEIPRVMEAVSAQQSSQTTQKNILVIDDSADTRNFINNILDQKIYKITEATNGVEGLALLESETPDLILLDLEMPEMDGIETLKKLRGNPKFVDTDIVIISEHLGENELEFVNREANDYLRKPFHPQEFLEKIEHVLSDPFEKELDSLKRTVLIVDDEEAIRDLVAEYFQEAGFNAITGKNGMEALFLFKKYPIDVLVSDIRMPQVDGLMLSRMISKEDPEVPIVLMSGNVVELPEELKKKLGVAKLVSKPFELDVFGQLVLDLLDERGITAPRKTDKTAKTKNKKKKTTIKEPELKIVASQTEKSEAASAIKGGNLLLVDDSEDMQTLFKLLMKKEPFEIEIAENGKLGLEKFKKGDYQFVFMDINMPVMDGVEAVQKMRKWEKSKNKSTPIIAITANDSAEDIKKYIESGFNRHISKPISKQKILGMMEKKAS